MAVCDFNKRRNALRRARAQLTQAKEDYKDAREKFKGMKLDVAIARQRFRNATKAFEQAQTDFDTAPADDWDWRKEANEIADGLNSVLLGMQSRRPREETVIRQQEPQTAHEPMPAPRLIESNSIFPMLLGLGGPIWPRLVRRDENRGPFPRRARLLI